MQRWKSGDGKIIEDGVKTELFIYSSQMQGRQIEIAMHLNTSVNSLGL